MHDLITDLMQWSAWIQQDRSGLRDNAQLHVGLAHIRKLFIHQQGGAVGHTPRTAAGAKAASLATESMGV